jgi:membrane protease YdiL (CAAX protease family)
VKVIQQKRDQTAPIAPRWHTTALIALIFAVAISGSLLARGGSAPSSAAPSGRVAGYLAMMVVPWMLTLYVARVGRARSALSFLVFPEARGAELRRLPVDLGIAALCAVSIRVCERLLAPPVDARHATAIAAMLPHGALEHALWVLVAISVGFGEEVVYRGYLRAQLAAFTKSPWLGVVLQAFVFGVAHTNQGLAAAARIAFYGLAFGAVVQLRGSLVPTIAAHVAIDAASGWG